MKKILSFVVIVIFASACNKEKTYKEELTGEWSVYKYLQYNIDKTTDFLNRHPEYTIVFTEDQKFIETYLPTGDTLSTTATGSYEFADNLEKIVITDTLYRLVDTVMTAIAEKRTYTIFNLQDDHVQLRNDTSQLYMRKNPQ